MRRLNLTSLKTAFQKAAPFEIALLSMLIYYLSIPPVSLRYTIFLVPAIWAAILVPNRMNWQKPERGPKRPGFLGFVGRWTVGRLVRGEYRQYWLAAFAFWLATLHWVGYPHPATILGMLALCGYLSCYLPLFVFQSRLMRRVLRLPIWLATTLSWLAVESLRNVVFGGFSLAGLSYALYDAPKFIQIADFFGEYGVSLMIMLSGSLLGLGILGGDSRKETGDDSAKKDASPRLISFAAMVVLATYVYGYSTISRFDAMENEAIAHGSRPARLALLQCGTTYRFPVPDSLTRQVEDAYLALANEASADPRGYDAIVWPEGTYPGFFVDFSYDPATTPEDESVKDTVNEGALHPSERRFSRDWTTRRMRADRLEYANLTARLKTPALLGMASAVFDEQGKETSHNALVYVPYFGSESESAGLSSEILEHAPTSSYSESRADMFRRYDKVALVMFGEYIPFADKLPDSWDLKAVCADVALGRGRGPSTFSVPARDGSRSYTIAPHICFESIVPQFISNQLAELRGANVDPDILMNVSNDGWFRNGLQTDLHLASMVFRAVENRRPLATATHGGFSAYIDAAGRVRAKGKRGGTEVVDANVAIVKTHPHALIRFGNGDEPRFVFVPDVMRRVGLFVFFMSVVAQFILVAVRGRAAKIRREV